MRFRCLADCLARGLAIVLAVGMLLPLVSAHSAQTDSPSGDNTLHRKNILKTIIVDNYYPYTFMNPDGQPDGLSVDLIRAVAKSIGLQVEIAMATWDDARKALAAGDIDLLPMMAYSEQRAKDFDFSTPHTIAHDAIFVKKGDTRIQSMDDLRGKHVIVMGKDAAHDFLLSKGISTPDHLVLTDSLPEALRQLALGKGDAALMPKLVGLLLLNNLGLSNLEALPAVVNGYERAFSIAVKKSDKTLLGHLSEGLSIVAATGEYAKIHRKWFGLVDPSVMPFAPVMKYVLLAIPFIVLIAIVIGLWSLSLRKQVALRTRTLAQEVEERKRAEAEMKRLASFPILNPNPVVEVDVAGHVHFCNPAAEQIFPDLGQRCLRHPWLADWESVTHKFREEGSTSMVREVPIDEKWYQQTLNFVENIQHVRIYGLDITQSKRAQEALQNSEYEFRTLAEAMPQIVWITRPDGWNIYFNQQWMAYTGQTLEESCGHGWNKPFHPDDQQRAWDAWQDATKNGATYALDCRLRRADGVYTWWLIRGVPILDARGAILKWFGTCTDINELKQAEESLRRHSERLENLNRIDQAILLALESPEAVVQTALQHMRGLLQCQRASVGIFDLEKKEVHVYAADVDGKTIVQVGKILTEEAYGAIDILRQSRMEIVEDMSKVTSPSAVHRILQAEGIQSSINVALVSALEMYGVLNVGWENPKTITPGEIGIAGEVASQITIAIEKARLLKETRRYAAELEQRVVQRTAQFEAANQELEAFSYSVSHDLRAPLRHIDGYVQLLVSRCRENLGDKGQRYVDTIADSARRMGLLIDNLLEFSRTGRAEMRRESLDMNQALQEARGLLHESHSGRAIEWNVSDLPLVQGDYALLRQVWVNLLDNAVKYTRPRDVAQIKVSARTENGEIVFVVADNGVGFAMQYAGKLFGVFKRLHSQEEFEGTGIGLATVQRIITRHGGRVWAEAELDQGARFYFTLPIF